MNEKVLKQMQKIYGLKSLPDSCIFLTAFYVLSFGSDKYTQEPSPGLEMVAQANESIHIEDDSYAFLMGRAFSDATIYAVFSLWTL